MTWQAWEFKVFMINYLVPFRGRIEGVSEPLIQYFNLAVASHRLLLKWWRHEIIEKEPTEAEILQKRIKELEAQLAAQTAAGGEKA